jgi:hypothetical protein
MGSKRSREVFEDVPEQIGTCHPAGSPVPDDPGALAADDLPLGVRKHKRAKVGAMPPPNGYELQRLEKIQQNKQALPLPNFRLPRALATRAPNPSALPMCRTHLLQFLDAQKFGETHANMQAEQAPATKTAAVRVRAKQDPSAVRGKRISERLLTNPPKPFIDGEPEDGLVF